MLKITTRFSDRVVIFLCFHYNTDIKLMRGENRLNGFFGHQYELYPFQIFSAYHVIILIVFLFVCLCIVKFRESLKKSERVIKIAMFIGLFLLESLYHIWLYAGEQWDMTFALPFHLCSISLLLCLVLLVTDSKHIFQFVYFLGLAGAVQAIVTPELFVGFPHFRFFQFFITHMLIIWVALFYVCIKGYVVTKRGMWQAFTFLNLSAVLAYLANVVTGGNYMFLARKPSNPSLLDYLGPYPFYILVLEGIAFILFFILYLPWIKREGKK